jgi:hypothetical protein
VGWKETFTAEDVGLAAKTKWARISPKVIVDSRAVQPLWNVKQAENEGDAELSHGLRFTSNSH